MEERISSDRYSVLTLWQRRART